MSGAWWYKSLKEKNPWESHLRTHVCVWPTNIAYWKCDGCTNTCFLQWKKEEKNKDKRRKELYRMLFKLR